ncbi:Uu.00g122500.m01.CDS01 [Anthostomella pinea]|uniref:Uu.00g122500.m01.CDS01 n=1 Tax=Anthostomella pinea TaxID=933095 RepID=A0AAI8VHW7_9PEZI|nr:Uu.00g122500.m01.CDS01 [Anthostomella pinea]
MAKAHISHDYYADLQLPPTCSNDDIKKQYRKLALRYHPDRNGGNEESTLKFQAIQTAREVLGDRVTEEKYDEDRRNAGPYPSHSPSQQTQARGNPQYEYELKKWWLKENVPQNPWRYLLGHNIRKRGSRKTEAKLYIVPIRMNSNNDENQRREWYHKNEHDLRKATLPWRSAPVELARASESTMITIENNMLAQLLQNEPIRRTYAAARLLVKGTESKAVEKDSKEGLDFNGLPSPLLADTLLALESTPDQQDDNVLESRLLQDHTTIFESSSHETLQESPESLRVFGENTHQQSSRTVSQENEETAFGTEGRSVQPSLRGMAKSIVELIPQSSDVQVTPSLDMISSSGWHMATQSNSVRHLAQVVVWAGALTAPAYADGYVDGYTQYSKVHVPGSSNAEVDPTNGLGKLLLWTIGIGIIPFAISQYVQRVAQTSAPDLQGDRSQVVLAGAPSHMRPSIVPTEAEVYAAGWHKPTWPESFLSSTIHRMLKHMRPRPYQGYKRLEWRCSCGQVMYGDYLGGQDVTAFERTLGDAYSGHDSTTAQDRPSLAPLMGERRRLAVLGVIDTNRRAWPCIEVMGCMVMYLRPLYWLRLTHHREVAPAVTTVALLLSIRPHLRGDNYYYSVIRNQVPQKLL